MNDERPSIIVMKRELSDAVHNLVKASTVTAELMVAAVTAMAQISLHASGGDIRVGFVPAHGLPEANKEPEPELEPMTEPVPELMTEPQLAQIHEMFKGHGWKDFSAAIDELGVPCNAITCRKYFNMLPKSIKLDALRWGLGDTEVRDSAYVFLRDKINGNKTDSTVIRT